jgi:hypothetical protein
MDDDEARQSAAEHKAAALHDLGWETGAGAAIWLLLATAARRRPA